ncbi:MAG: PAS domain S-box protein, partial [Actinomycetota bacterium]
MLGAIMDIEGAPEEGLMLPLIEQMPIAVAVFDRQMNYLAVSKPWLAAYGRRHTDLVGRNYYQAHPGVPQEWRRIHNEVLLGKELRDGEESWVEKDGTRHRVKWSAVPWRDGRGVTRGIIISAEDITPQKAAEERLRQAAAVIASVQEGIVITDRHAVIQEVNPAFTRITEYSEEELRGRHMRILQSGRHDRVFYQVMWDSLAASGAWQGEIWNRRKGGEIYLEWLSISAIRDEEGQVANYVAVTIDLSRMEHAQSELERLAHHDALTRLPNRLLLMSRLEHALDRVARLGGQGAVLFIDLDRFKEANDSLGHRAGDELLQLATRRWQERLRDMDTLARLGGDEFVVIIEDVAH